MNNLKTFRWIGGKHRLKRRIIELFPDHKLYCEPFGGSGAVLFAKEPSLVEVFNEINGHIIDFFRVLQDEQMSRRLIKKLKYTPCSLQVFNEYKKTWMHQADLVDKVAQWYTILETSFGGNFGSSWGRHRDNRASEALRFKNKVDQLDAVVDRLRLVSFECRDFREIIDFYDKDYTLFYCDPPYLPSTRCNNLYDHEMTMEDHQELADQLSGLKAKVVLSGYPNEIYDGLGWRRVDFDLKEALNSNTAPRTESVYLNF